MIEKIRPYLKASAAAVVCAAAYLVGVVPAEGGLGDLGTVQWLGLVVFMGGAYGVTFHVPYQSTKTGEAGAADVGLALLIVAVLGIALLLFGVSFK